MYRDGEEGLECGSCNLLSCLVLSFQSLQQLFIREKKEGRGPGLSKSVTKSESGHGFLPGAERAGGVTLSDRRQMRLGRVSPPEFHS